MNAVPQMGNKLNVICIYQEITTTKYFHITTAVQLLFLHKLQKGSWIIRFSQHVCFADVTSKQQKEPIECLVFQSKINNQ